MSYQTQCAGCLKTYWECACSTVTALCPKCGKRQEDMDGFGVLYCEHCKWCSHPSITEGRCELCAAVVANT